MPSDLEAVKVLQDLGCIIRVPVITGTLRKFSLTRLYSYSVCSLVVLL